MLITSSGKRKKKKRDRKGRVKNASPRRVFRLSLDDLWGKEGTVCSPLNHGVIALFLSFSRHLPSWLRYNCWTQSPFTPSRLTVLILRLISFSVSWQLKLEAGKLITIICHVDEQGEGQEGGSHLSEEKMNPKRPKIFSAIRWITASSPVTF